MSATIRDTLVGNVREIVIDRPKVRNAFDNATYHALAEALEGAQADHETRVVFLRGEGEHFCAGQDLSEMTHLPREGEVIGFERLLDALTVLDVPVVTAVRGSAVGLGTTMLLHTDVNFFGDDAKLRCPFVPLGVVPEAGSSALFVSRLGYARTAEFLFTGRLMTPAEAVEAGLGVAVLPAGEVVEHARAVARQIAEGPPRALRLTKKLLRDGEREGIEAARAREVQAFRLQLGSPENREAIRAFFEKRKPRFE
jgi:enoyl-CoA hydratase/carnithine racemase